MKEVSIFWFRRDLRLSDNLALFFAASSGFSVVPIFIFDDLAPKTFEVGACSRWWLHHSLDQLNRSLGGKLNIYVGDPEKIVKKVVGDFGASGVFWNNCYEPWEIKVEKKIKKMFVDQEVDCQGFDSNLIWPPNSVLKKDGTSYKVFTSFFKAGLQVPIAAVKNKPKLSLLKDLKNKTTLEGLGLIADKELDRRFSKLWSPGEVGAEKRLSKFLEVQLEDYEKFRDFPSQDGTSHLSPYLHFGEISPRKIWSRVEGLKKHGKSGAAFLRQLVWRDFAKSLLINFPSMIKKNMREKFDKFPWDNDQKKINAWKGGKTGYPIVDAGMRELFQTGYMHNRVRMVVASFLTKNLLVDWQIGARWFEDRLVDADLASNAANWQWVAGTGIDSAPYFRIFNPVSQGQKFDPAGEYIKKFVPELQGLSEKYLFAPWEAPGEVLQDAGVRLGRDYPEPIVGLKESRELALKYYKKLK